MGTLLGCVITAVVMATKFVLANHFWLLLLRCYPSHANFEECRVDKMLGGRMVKSTQAFEFIDLAWEGWSRNLSNQL